jgi:hypothetical protein
VKKRIRGGSFSANLRDRPKAARPLQGPILPAAAENFIVAKSRILIRIGPALAGAFLFGCLGGEIDTPPARYSPEDTALVFVPSPDTTTPPSDDPPVVAGGPGMLFDRLHTGDKWTFSQKGDGYGGATVSMEILSDSVYGPDSVYVESILVQVPLFYSPYGDTVLNYTQAGRLYLRKSDRETAHDTITTLAEIHYFGDTVASVYRRDAASVSTFTGAVPDTLKAGRAWTVKAARSAAATWGWDGLVYAASDTSWTDTVEYSVRASAKVTVKAGTFPVLQVNWATRGSESPSVGWYAPAAKAMVREIDGPAGTADTTELREFTLK